jgi:C4-dicarboxylate-specific signal transduction histidine kinase
MSRGIQAKAKLPHIQESTVVQDEGGIVLLTSSPDLMAWNMEGSLIC